MSQRLQRSGHAGNTHEFRHFRIEEFQVRQHRIQPSWRVSEVISLKRIVREPRRVDYLHIIAPTAIPHLPNKNGAVAVVDNLLNNRKHTVGFQACRTRMASVIEHQCATQVRYSFLKNFSSSGPLASTLGTRGKLKSG